MGWTGRWGTAQGPKLGAEQGVGQDVGMVVGSGQPGTRVQDSGWGIAPPGDGLVASGGQKVAKLVPRQAAGGPLACWDKSQASAGSGLYWVVVKCRKLTSSAIS